MVQGSSGVEDFSVILSSFIEAQHSASIDLGFADPMYAVKWNDHSGQSLCSPVNIGALPIVRVSTSGAVTFGTAATCCRVSIKARALSVSDVPSTPPCQLSSDLLPLLRLKCCFGIGSTPSLPRLRIALLCLVSLDTTCSSTPQYTCTTAVH